MDGPGSWSVEMSAGAGEPVGGGDTRVSPEVDGRRRCLLCGRPATHRPTLLLVPSRTYAGKPWRVHLSVAVCAGHRSPLPDELLGMMDKLHAELEIPRIWEQLLAQATGAKPHYTSTRVEYAPIEDDDRQEAN